MHEAAYAVSLSESSLVRWLKPLLVTACTVGVLAAAGLPGEAHAQTKHPTYSGQNLPPVVATPGAPRDVTASVQPFDGRAAVIGGSVLVGLSAGAAGVAAWQFADESWAGGGFAAAGAALAGVAGGLLIARGLDVQSQVAKPAGEATQPQTSSGAPKAAPRVAFGLSPLRGGGGGFVAGVF